MASKIAEVKNSNTTANDVADQIATLRNDVSDLTRLIGELGKAKGGELSDAAKDKAEELRKRAQTQVDVVADHAAAAQDQANDFIKNQPAAALGIAAGLGFLVGFISSRK